MLTVPFAPVARDEYRRGKDFYWSSVSNKAEDGSVFFQRRYSEPALCNRLITPSGLRLRELLFVGERVFVQSKRKFFEYLPPLTHPLIGPAQAPLACVLQTPHASEWRA